MTTVQWHKEYRAIEEKRRMFKIYQRLEAVLLERIRRHREKKKQKG